MNIKFIEHAEIRMKERGASSKEALLTIESGENLQQSLIGLVIGETFLLVKHGKENIIIQNRLEHALYKKVMI